jgi:type IV secretion system protein VirB10
MNLLKTLFARPAEHQRTARPEAEAEPADTVVGERGIASVNRGRSLQSRMSNLLAMGLVGALGLGLLSWYYSQAWAHQKTAREDAHKAVRASAQGDMPLPALGRVEPPATAQPDGVDRMLGGPPELPPAAAAGTVAVSTEAPGSPARLAADRRLAGPVFAASNGAPAGSVAPGGSALPTLYPQPAGPPVATGEGELGALLKPTVAAAVRAKVLPSQQLLLPKGAFVDCTLETAIDSSLPGLTTCVTATDTFGADGRVVLLERGTKLFGETRGEVRQGGARIFVLWTEARTPTGVVVPLASPGTDELGRSGLPGQVDRHFLDRFGAALLISVIEGAVQAAAQPKSGGAVIYNPTAATDVVTEVLKSTVNIPPTVRKQNGDRIQILVARDLDFRSVYALHTDER